MENETKQYQPVSIGNWMISMIITSIPLVNIIVLFVWAFNKNTHPSKSNWAKATLMFIAIVVVFYLVLAIGLGIGMATASSQPY